MVVAEYLLLGLLETTDRLAVAILDRLGVDRGELRDAVLERLGPDAA
jgi:hypothetical protein